MEVFSLSGLINSIIALSIGALVFIRNRHATANRVFSLFALSVALWSFGYWRWLSASNSETALFWIKLFTLASTFIPALYFHWITFMLEADNKIYFRYIQYPMYATSVILIVFLFSSELVIQGVTQRLFFPYWPVPGILYSLNIGIYAIAIIYSIALLTKNLSLADEAKRKQFLFVIVGSIIGFGGGATNFFLWYGIPIPPYGNFLVALGLFLWGYAAAKYHLFNIRAVIAELLTFTIWIAVLIELLSAKTWEEQLARGGLFALVVALGIMIIRSVLKEIRQREELERLNRLKSEFLSFASHQIKAPMTVVKGYASMIYDGSYGPLPEGVKQTAIRIKEASDRLIGLVGEFLDLRKIEEGRMEYRFDRINIVELVDSILTELKVLAQNKKLNLTFKRPAEEISVTADKEKLRQVIQNLVENAIKYTDKGYVRVKVRTEKGAVLIAIKDSGRGMPQSLIPNLFQQFSRDSKAAKEIQGTGLGLYIAKEIIKAHNGKIRAESEGEGKGATFYVEVPGEAG